MRRVPGAQLAVAHQHHRRARVHSRNSLGQGVDAGDERRVALRLQRLGRRQALVCGMDTQQHIRCRLQPGLRAGCHQGLRPGHQRLGIVRIPGVHLHRDAGRSRQARLHVGRQRRRHDVRQRPVGLAAAMLLACQRRRHGDLELV